MRIAVNGVRLFVDVDGAKLVPDGTVMREKPTMVLLHGGPGQDHSPLKIHFPALAESVQLVYVDMRGHGRSDWDSEENWNLAQWADDVRGLCDALEVADPIVYGESFGGFVAMEVAARYPTLVSKLILASTRARPTSFEDQLIIGEKLGGQAFRNIFRRWNEDATNANADRLGAAIAQLGSPDGDSDAGERLTRNPEVLRWFRRRGGEADTMDLLPRLRNIVCPVLIIFGEDDPIVPAIHSHEIADAMVSSPRVVLRPVPGARHIVQRYAPTQFVSFIREFVLS
jgi:pimeloyl-ACP methyl ester carboxylesterase